MTRKEIRETIADMEYHDRGYNKLSGIYVTTHNLYLTKGKARVDIIIKNTQDNTEERINRCVYDLDKIQEFFEKEKKNETSN